MTEAANDAPGAEHLNSDRGRRRARGTRTCGGVSDRGMSWCPSPPWGIPTSLVRPAAARWVSDGRLSVYAEGGDDRK